MARELRSGVAQRPRLEQAERHTFTAMGSAEDVIRRLSNLFTLRDAAGVVGLFADDGVFQDRITRHRSVP
jgi:hypothetical protein